MRRASRRNADDTAFWRARDAYQVQRFAEGLMGTLFLLALLRYGWLHSVVRLSGLACILAAVWYWSTSLLRWISSQGEHDETRRTQRPPGKAHQRET
jgi:hypothetical protein